MGNKGEEIRGALDEGHVRATIFTKEERREREGEVWYGDEA